MAENAASECLCVIDTDGLHELARVSGGNFKTTLVAHLKGGTICVPSWAWQEFKTLYPDEAAELAKYISARIQFNKAVHVRAARITERLNLGFSKGAYDAHIELYTASIAINKGLIVLTSNDNLSAYDGMDCTVKSLTEWVNTFE